MFTITRTAPAAGEGKPEGVLRHDRAAERWFDAWRGSFPTNLPLLTFQV